MDPLIRTHRQGFPHGLTHITRHTCATETTGIGIAVLKLKPTENYMITLENEMAFLLMQGHVTVTVEKEEFTANRTSLFDEQPTCVHASKGIKISILAHTEVEFTVYQCANEKIFPYQIFVATDGVDEHRGKGLLGGACLRYVRTIFDDTNSDPNAELVLGEVIAMPGKWSSYPPHSHPQPELYHYRFTDPRGWGHAELSDDVFKIREYDTIRIIDDKTHAQVSAPGYGMYYSWVILHLPNSRYGVQTFEEDHQWTMDPDATYWKSEEL